MILSHLDPRLSWHGHVSLEQTSCHTRPWRIPFAGKALFHPDLADRAASQAGVRLAFTSDTRRIAGTIVLKEENQKLDLLLDGKWFATADLANTEHFVFEGLPEGTKRIELWLPQRGDFALRELEVDDGAQVAPLEDTRPRWVTYGSSITHCASSDSPIKTWPAIVALEQGWNLTSLGFGGQCHLDSQIARLMRDLTADYLSICAGINIYGAASLTSRSFAAAVIGFVQIIREKHPTTPLALISPIFSDHRETTPNAAGWTLQDYRTALRETTDLLRAQGDSHVHYVDGLDLFSEEHGHLLPDQLHPNTEGYEIMGRNFLKTAVPLLLQK